jgi:hypothetical protein
MYITKPQRRRLAHLTKTETREVSNGTLVQTAQWYALRNAVA